MNYFCPGGGTPPKAGAVWAVNGRPEPVGVVSLGADRARQPSMGTSVDTYDGAKVPGLKLWRTTPKRHFDRSKLATVPGIVKEFLWANPHALIYLEVTGAGGRIDVDLFEGPRLGH